MTTPSRPVDTGTSATNAPTPATANDQHRLTARIAGKTPVLLLWLLGIPLPIILIIFLVKGCS